MGTPVVEGYVLVLLLITVILGVYKVSNSLDYYTFWFFSHLKSLKGNKLRGKNSLLSLTTGAPLVTVSLEDHEEPIDTVVSFVLSP